MFKNKPMKLYLNFYDVNYNKMILLKFKNEFVSHSCILLDDEPIPCKNENFQLFDENQNLSCNLTNHKVELNFLPQFADEANNSNCILAFSNSNTKM